MKYLFLFVLSVFILSTGSEAFAGYHSVTHPENCGETGNIDDNTQRGSLDYLPKSYARCMELTRKSLKAGRQKDETAAARPTKKDTKPASKVQKPVVQRYYKITGQNTDKDTTK